MIDKHAPTNPVPGQRYGNYVYEEVRGGDAALIQLHSRHDCTCRSTATGETCGVWYYRPESETPV
jgi:hypothetical protein